MDDNPVYYDVEKKKLYWIEWFDTGNNEIPTRHYIESDVKEVERCKHCGVSLSEHHMSCCDKKKPSRPIA